ncbi:hypothetical protein SAV14893_037570 [Streptomyces avermitilis]|uniref:Protein kinase domain-containing protein n=1 Tax=Streptomyces avermitilis TaxID=33903 RepID=A0A4D4LV37_STRAX|nr:hypothetical protein SAV14893_037570 [Streptomyces avermitilis]
MGEVFAGRYELVDPIGRGGVGAVWRAWDHRRRRYVAAKVLQQSDAHALLRFVREQAMRIDHPHVLAPASWAADDDKVLFTMDLVAGGSLVHLIGDYGPLPRRSSAPCSTSSSRGSPRCTRRGSCTATSSRPTCCSKPPARVGPGCACPTSASPCASANRG